MSDNNSPFDKRITSRKSTVISPWVKLVEKSVADSAGAAIGEFHSLEIADYVSIIAVTADGRIPLVRQFRPAIEQSTLEFPGGLLDAGETPARCAARELREETGFVAGEITSLGAMVTDSGRLGNRTWGFYTNAPEPVAGWTAEPGVEPLFATKAELHDMIQANVFNHAPHLALYALAKARGFL